MQGRLENEMKIQKSAEIVLKNTPDFIKEWYLNLQASRKTAASCYKYLMHIKKFLEYINLDVHNITPEQITLLTCESYLISCQTKKNKNGMEVLTSDSYQLTVWHVLNSLLTFLVKRNYIPENYMSYIQRPKNRDLERVNQQRVLLTAKDFKKILKTAKQGNIYSEPRFVDRNVSIILIFLTTGVRCSALTEINVSDIDFKNHILNVVDKGNKTHTYILNDELLEHLNKWLIFREQILKGKANDALFINRSGDRISSKGISDVVTSTCGEAIGKRLSPHKLRSGFCSILYDKTHDIEFVRRVVGHSNIRTTQRYIKTDSKEKEKAIHIMDNILKV